MATRERDASTLGAHRLGMGRFVFVDVRAARDGVRGLGVRPPCGTVLCTKVRMLEKLEAGVVKLVGAAERRPSFKACLLWARRRR